MQTIDLLLISDGIKRESLPFSLRWAQASSLWSGSSLRARVANNKKEIYEVGTYTDYYYLD